MTTTVPAYLSRRAAAAYVGISEDTLRRWIGAGLVKARRLDSTAQREGREASTNAKVLVHIPSLLAQIEQLPDA